MQRRHYGTCQTDQVYDQTSTNVANTTIIGSANFNLYFAMFHQTERVMKSGAFGVISLFDNPNLIDNKALFMLAKSRIDFHSKSNQKI
jgi:hypothetical protein